jgi:putative hemolysin
VRLWTAREATRTVVARGQARTDAGRSAPGRPGDLSCGDDDEDPGVPNPAAVFCEEQGEDVEFERDDVGNERGICVLPDGTRVDEWEYYRVHHPEAD